MRPYFHATGFASVLIFSACTSTFMSAETKASSSESPFRLVILHTNDHHGHPLKFDNYPMKDVGGLPARATLVSEIRKREANVLLLDAGDLNIGRPESNFFNGEPDIVGYNQLAYDAAALGNHEFDRGMVPLAKQMAQATFPFLNANLSWQEASGAPKVKPFIVKDFQGTKVAILGLMCRDAFQGLGPAVRKAVTYNDEVVVAKQLVPQLRKEAQLIVALTHCGVEKSDSEGSRRLAREVEGIDLVVDGHSHTRMEKMVLVSNAFSKRAVPVVQAWQWGMELGRTDLLLKKGEQPVVSFQAIPVNLKRVTKNEKGEKIQNTIGNPVTEDPILLAKLKPYSEKVDSMLGASVANMKGDFDNFAVRSKESPLGNLVADATLEFGKSFGAQFAVQNGGSIRSGIAKGTVTKKAVYEALPYDNSVVVLTLSGGAVRQMFDMIAAVGPGAGSFLQVAGVRVAYDGKLKKATEIVIGGVPLSDDKWYKLATNSFIAEGGDDFKMLASAKERYDSSANVRDVVIAYLQQKKEPLVPVTNDRIRMR